MSGEPTCCCCRAAIAAPVLVLVARLTAPRAQPLARRDCLAFLVLGLTGLVGNTTLWFWGLKHTTALNAGIIGASSPLFIAVPAAVLLGDRPSGRNWLGIALTVAAVLVTVAIWVIAGAPGRAPRLGGRTLRRGARDARPYLVRAIGPGRTTGFLNLMPFVVIGLAWLLIGEAIHAYHLVGAAMVIAGVFLVTRPTG